MISARLRGDARFAAATADTKRRALEAAARIQGGDQSRAAFDALEDALVTLYYDAAVLLGVGGDELSAACVQRNVLADRAPLCTASEVAHLVHLVRGAVEAVP